ncbi:MAG: glycine cleavage system protein H, partial [Gemmatimonadales bacterium]|nr:glycine cleavage system protein H [Gemmatimonadales bacterium]
MANPGNLKYSAEHEWLADDGTVGITAFAVEQIGDIVFVELPAVGSSVTQSQPFGVIESVKAVSELFAPASGKVVAVNEAL